MEAPLGREPPLKRNLIIGSQVLLFPFAPHLIRYIGFNQPDERKKGSFAWFCKQDVPKTEQLEMPRSRKQNIILCLGEATEDHGKDLRAGNALGSCDSNITTA